LIISRGVSPRKLKRSLSKRKINCHGVSSEEILIFFVPACSCKKASKSFATSLRVETFLLSSVISLIQTGAPVSGHHFSASITTFNH